MGFVYTAEKTLQRVAIENNFHARRFNKLINFIHNISLLCSRFFLLNQKYYAARLKIGYNLLVNKRRALFLSEKNSDALCFGKLFLGKIILTKLHGLSCLNIFVELN